MPAKAGIHYLEDALDSRLRRNDKDPHPALRATFSQGEKGRRPHPVGLTGDPPVFARGQRLFSRREKDARPADLLRARV
jgi:hypothetical protein